MNTGSKKNWLSVLIFAPVFAFLGFSAYGYADKCVQAFPNMLIAALFCLMQLVLYMLVYFPDIKQKLAGILIPIISVIVVLSVKPSAEMGSTQTLPDAPAFSDEATISIDDESIANAFFVSPGDGTIYLSSHAYGTATITVVDGEETVQYTLEIYYEDRAPQTRITLVG